MKNKWMKKKRSRMNKAIRKTNETLYKDPLWLGRFYVKQVRVCGIVPFEDGYSGMFSMELLACDKKTKATHRFWVDNYDYPWVIFREVNRFIVEIVKVWDEDPKPSIYHPQDFRKIDGDVHEREI